MGNSIIRKRVVLGRLGCSKTYFDETYVKTGRLHPIYLSSRLTAFFEDEVESLIEDIRRERDRALQQQPHLAPEDGDGPQPKPKLRAEGDRGDRQPRPRHARGTNTASAKTD